MKLFAASMNNLSIFVSLVLLVDLLEFTKPSYHLCFKRRNPNTCQAEWSVTLQYLRMPACLGALPQFSSIYWAFNEKNRAPFCATGKCWERNWCSKCNICYITYKLVCFRNYIQYNMIHTALISYRVIMGIWARYYQFVDYVLALWALKS